MGTTQELASFIVNCDFSQVPEEVARIAKEAFLDCLGVTIAGATEPSGKLITQWVKEQEAKPEAGVVAGGVKTAVPLAALANGTLAHALDYDDVTSAMIGHPSVPVVPVVLGLGEAHQISGQDALLAYIVGFEVEAKLGSGIGRRHYVSGWHSTATLGTMGAAAAAAKLLGLGVEETRMALGIAASEAAGLRQNFGTMTKPLHAGNAAMSGVIAASLARLGFTADKDILESPFGFCRVLGGEGEYDLAKITQGLGSPFALVSPGVSLKPYPACRVTHGSIDAILHLVTEHQIAADEVARVECHISRRAPQILIHPRPQTGLEGKFSMQYCLARALLDKEVRLAQFSDSKVQDPEAQRLLEKVVYVHPEQEAEFELVTPVTVTIKLRDGREYSKEIKSPKGDPDNPLSHEEVVAKYRDCAGLVLTEEAVESSLRMALALEELADVGKLMDVVTSRAKAAV